MGRGGIELMAKTVMIVDDEPDLVELLRMGFEDSGFVVCTAGNGQEALDLLRGGLRPGLILLDLMMPVMNGRQFCAVRANDPLLAGIPVVVITGAGNAQTLPEIAGPIERIIEKPCELALLLDLAAKYCGEPLLG